MATKKTGYEAPTPASDKKKALATALAQLEKSYGKGIMQTTYPLGDGSAVRITVAEIYTAGGNQYHGKGLEVDVFAEYTEEQAATWFLLSGENDPYIAAALQSLK